MLNNPSAMHATSTIEKSNKIWAIMPAAGSGQRMGASIAKQYLEINGHSLLAISLGVLLDETQVEQVVVCTAKDDQYWPKLELANNPKIKRVDGGESRALSVCNALLSINAQPDDWVMVHDAARPCLSAHLLSDFITQLKGHHVGGLLAVPVRDTLKKVQDGVVEKTLDRSDVWQAQTPQMFRYDLLKSALESALNNGLEITDEASAIELAGHLVGIVVGDQRNLKVTTPEDLALAEFILSNN